MGRAPRPTAATRAGCSPRRSHELGLDDGTGVEVTLRLPPPLERPLTVTRDGERVLLLDGEALVAEARAGDPGVTPPTPPTLRRGGGRRPRAERARGARSSTSASSAARRPEGDGLEIHAGLVAGRDDGLVATTWVARDVRPEIVWAVIDCPGAYSLHGDGRGDPLLARITARVDRLPEEGERCVVAAWPLDEDGRKRHAATALYGEDGLPIAVSRQLWIAPRPEPGIAGRLRWQGRVTGTAGSRFRIARSAHRITPRRRDMLFHRGVRGVSATSSPPSSS